MKTQFFPQYQILVLFEVMLYTADHEVSLKKQKQLFV